MALINPKQAAGIQHWLDGGADPSKINLGVGTYGRSFTLADPSQNQLYDPIIGGGVAGPYTRQEGILGYNEVRCLVLSDIVILRGVLDL